MRFHVGFSKRIRIKTLIQFLGFLFVGLLAFLGLTEHAFAWTTFNQSGDTSTDVKSIFYGFKSVGYDFYSNPNGEIVSFDCDFANNIYCGLNVQTSGTTTQNFATLNAGTSQKAYFGNTFNVAIQTGFPSNSNIADRNKGTTHYYELYLKNDNSVCTSDSSNKSVNIRGSFIYSYTGTPAISDFNEGYSIANIFTTKINAYDDTNDRAFITSCNTTYQTHNGNYYHYTYECPNVYIGDSSITINKFGINFINNMPFEDMFKGSGTGGLNGTLRFLATKNPSMYSLPSLSYECSTDNPVIDNQPDYTEGLKNANDLYKEHYDSNIPGFDSDLINIPLPEHFTDLLTMPLDIIQAVVDNSSQCSPAQIDFSSIIRRWGDPNGSYVLNLPCMRDTMDDLLGGIYIVCDLLLAAIVFYNVIMNLIQLVDALTSGEDLYSYFFRRTDQNGDHVNHKTGEVG